VQRRAMPWKDRTIVSIREEFVLRALEPRTNLAALCREFGVTRKTGYKWVERYKSGGVLALRDLFAPPADEPARGQSRGRRRPCRHPHRPPAVGSTEAHLGSGAERGKVDSCRAHGELRP
jgi:hypothetical protein